jgi:hypothetical protein
MALEAAIRTEDKTIIKAMCLELAETERNFILKKGETPLGVHRDDIERDYDKGVMSKLDELLKRAK